MVGNGIFETQSAEPTISQIEMNLLAQAPFRTNAVAVADNQHSNHQFRGNGRTTGMAVVTGQMLAKPAKVEALVDPSQ